MENNIIKNDTNNEYQKNAIAILDEIGANVKAYYIGLTCPKWGDEKVLTYTFIIQNSKGKTYISQFWNSVHDTSEYLQGLTDESISAYDILACLQWYNIGEYWDFIREYGYEPSEDSYRTYKAVKTEYEGLKALFTDEEMELLSGIC